MMVSPVTVRGWAHKGLLQAEATPGGHRRFRYEEVERFSRQWNPVGNQGPLRVLIVDDDRAIVGFLRELLEGGAHQTVVEAAYDGFDAGRKPAHGAGSHPSAAGARSSRREARRRFTLLQFAAQAAQ